MNYDYLNIQKKGAQDQKEVVKKREKGFILFSMESINIGATCTKKYVSYN